MLADVRVLIMKLMLNVTPGMACAIWFMYPNNVMKKRTALRTVMSSEPLGRAMYNVIQQCLIEIKCMVLPRWQQHRLPGTAHL